MSEEQEDVKRLNYEFNQGPLPNKAFVYSILISMMFTTMFVSTLFFIRWSLDKCEKTNTQTIVTEGSHSDKQQ